MSQTGTLPGWRAGVPGRRAQRISRFISGGHHTKSHLLGGLKQDLFSQFSRLEIWEEGVSGAVLSEGPGEDAVHASLVAPGAATVLSTLPCGHVAPGSASVFTRVRFCAPSPSLPEDTSLRRMATS